MAAGQRANTSCRLYDDAIGPAIERVAAPVRAFHRSTTPACLAGRARVDRGTNVLAQAVAAILGLPAASPDCPIQFHLTRDAAGIETWRRAFSGRSFASTQEMGTGRWAGLVVERFGPLAFAMAAIGDHGGLRVVPRHWSAFGMSMPRFLGPGADAVEHGADGRFNFDVAMRLPLIGLIVHYRGWLMPERPAAAASG